MPIRTFQFLGLGLGLGLELGSGLGLGLGLELRRLCTNQNLPVWVRDGVRVKVRI